MPLLASGLRPEATGADGNPDERVVGHGPGYGGGPVHDRQLRAAGGQGLARGRHARDLAAHVRSADRRFRALARLRPDARELPIVAFNAANLVLSAVILRLKLREGRDRRMPASDPA